MAVQSWRGQLDRMPPPPLAPPEGRCQMPDLLQRLTPRDQRDGLPHHGCAMSATRRVQVGLVARADVCVWHSLVVTGRLHGHLLRDLST
jgi:hypothetical protein